jgi:hypothetical protein
VGSLIKLAMVAVVIVCQAGHCCVHSGRTVERPPSRLTFACMCLLCILTAEAMVLTLSQAQGMYDVLVRMQPAGCSDSAWFALFKVPGCHVVIDMDRVPSKQLRPGPLSFADPAE